MRPRTPHASPFQALAIKWYALSRMAVFLARQIVLADKMRAAAGVHKARLLEAWLYAALVELSGEIATLTTDCGKLNEEDAFALRYLEVAHAMLGMLALMAARIKRSLACWLEHLASLMAGTPASPPLPFANRAEPPGYLDSS